MADRGALLDFAPMSPRAFLLITALCATQAIANAPARPAKPAQLGLCIACHGESGQGRTPGTPHIGGQDRLYLQLALRAYREGTRRSNPMNAIANTLQPEDIEHLAAWYSAQPGFAPAGTAR